MLTPRNVLKVRNISVTFITSLILLCFLVFPLSAFSVDYYVKTPANGGSDANSGLDWASAKATIGAAMALVNGDDSVNVAAGTYNEKVVFPGYNNIALRGGYPAAGGAAQDPAANPTIIDGAGISSAEPMVYVPVQGGGSSGYFGIVVDGFTIRNGTNTGNGCAGIESYSVGITIKRNIIENNTTTGASGWAGGIHIFCPLNDVAKVTIEQNIVRNNSAAAAGGINLEGAAGKTRKYTAYLVNNLIVGNHSTTTDPLWLRGVGGVEIMYPASASIVNCTIADNTAVHPTNPIGGVSISGYSAAEKGIAAIANSIIGHDSGKDILADANGTFWIAYSSVKDATISGTGVIHTNPLFVGAGDYHLTDTSPCKNVANTIGTVLTGPIKSPSWSYLPDVGWKSQPGYTDATVTLSWGDGVHNMSSQWRYDDALTTTWGYPVGRFFGTANAGCTTPSSCTADVSYHQIISNMSNVDASTYSYSTNNNWGGVDPWSSKQTMFYKGSNGYYGAWFLNGIAYTLHGTSKDGRLTGTWYFQTNGGPYFDSGIRTVDLDGKTRPAQTAYDMGAYEYYPPNQTPTDISLSGASVAENLPSGTTVGTLSTTDPDVGNTFTYSLVAGTGGTDNASFTISGSTLQTAAIFNYEAKNSYSIRVRSTDQGGLWLEEAFTITINNGNDPPLLSNFSKTLDQDTTLTFAASDFYAAFTDPDPGNSLQQIKITALPGHGTLMLSSVAVTLNQEIATTQLDNLTYVPAGGYIGSDSFGWNGSDGSLYASSAASANLTVLAINHTPTDIALSGTSVAEGQPGGTAVGTLSTTDPDVGDTFTYTLVAGTGGTDNASFSISGSTLQTAAPFNYQTKNSYSIRVRSTDQDGLFTEKAFTITVTKVGDINGDTKIDLIDFILVLQILSKQVGAGIGISGDINGDGKIGIEEAIYILQKLTGMR